MKHLYKKLSLLVLATLVSTMTMAQSAGEYLVEVVFFGQPSASLVMGTPPDLDWSDNAVKLDETARSDVQSIDPTRFRLSQEARKTAIRFICIRRGRNHWTTIWTLR